MHLAIEIHSKLAFLIIMNKKTSLKFDTCEFEMIIVPRLFEEKRRDIVFGFPSFRSPIGVCTLCKQLLLQFYSDSFETLQMS